jgi:hypothetical protein
VHPWGSCTQRGRRADLANATSGPHGDPLGRRGARLLAAVALLAGLLAGVTAVATPAAAETAARWVVLPTPTVGSTGSLTSERDLAGLARVGSVTVACESARDA